MELVFIDPAATIEKLEAVCKKAVAEKYTQLSVPPLLVKKAKELLKDSNMQLAAPIGYPYGWNAIEAKLSEIILAMVDGADELDLHINLTALKNNDWQYLAKELNMAMTVIRKQQRKINIVVDVSLLSAQDITKCCDLYGVAGIDCFTVNTGLNELPAEQLIESIRAQLADNVPLKLLSTELTALPDCIQRLAYIVK